MSNHTILLFNIVMVFSYILLQQISSHKITYGIKKKILIWNIPKEKYCRPFDTIGSGNALFKKFKCFYDNCYIYRNNETLANIRNPIDYDAIMFNGKILPRLRPEELPQQRTSNQIYIFVQLESAAKHPILSEYFNNFFNWTMTYRLDSDIPWTYFKIKTFDNKTVGPHKNIRWIPSQEMVKMNRHFKSKLRKKSKTAWFTSNCHTIRTEKDDYINLLNERLVKLGQKKVDIVYGTCGKKVCRTSKWDKFHSTLERDYYFYMAMENSYDKDFITNKLLTAFQHNTVPIVYGGADYTRFAPPGSFISVNNLSPNKLAAMITNLIKKPAKYHEFFKWRNHYYYTDNYDLNGVACELCEKLNRDTRRRSYRYFRRWWNRDHVEKYPIQESDIRRLPSMLSGFTTNIPERSEFPVEIFYKNQSIVPQADRSPKSILLWTPPDCKECSLFDGFKTGNRLFQDLECAYTNCYINRGSIWNNPVVYDAILILGKTVHEMQSRDTSYLPLRRTKNQVYVFVELDSPDAYPICQEYYDNYFNWTMSYRLDSDIPWPYFLVKTIDKEFIGPSKDAQWLKIKDMVPIEDTLQDILNNKMKLAVWTDTNCHKREIVEDMTVLSNVNDMSGRINYINELNKELMRLNSTPIDVYDQCGMQPLCPEDESGVCDIIKDDYLFYLAFENAIDRDFVTDSVLRAFKNDAVPVVFGGANYDRFLAAGSYLNAMQLAPKQLAEKMVELSKNRTQYHEFFKWRNFYTYEDNYKHKVGAACDLCAKLSLGQVQISKYDNFRFWWNTNWQYLCQGNKTVPSPDLAMLR